MCFTTSPSFHFDRQVLSTATMSSSNDVLLSFGIGALASYCLMEVVDYCKRQSLKKKMADSVNAPDHIKEELLARVKTFFGEKGLEKIKNSFVVVVGLGGVGSHCAHMLCRSGVGKLRIIDFDQVTLSSLNRHAAATLEDVGKSKAQVLKQKLHSIVPWCQIEAITEMFVMSQADSLLQGKPDFVIDCIDDINTKAELIAYCKRHDLPVITSMGAGGKSDPTRIRIAALSDCINDPLAQKMKWKLKKYQVAAESVLSVFSIEKQVVDLLPLDEEQKNAPQDFGVVDYLRLRVMPVLGTSPSIFGQALASYLLCQLGGKAYEPEVCERLSKNLKHKLRQVFRNNEMKRFQTDEEINLDDEDIEFVVQQVWRSRCAVTQKRFGGHIILTLTRWYAHLPPTLDNLVLMMQNEASKLAEEGPGAFPAEVVQRIEARLQWAKEVLARDEWTNTEGLASLAQSEHRRRTTLQRIESEHSRQHRVKLIAGNILLASIGLIVNVYK